jgi:hypothetical protein
MRVILRVILGLMGLVILSLAALAATPRIQAAIAIHRLESSDPAVRRRGLSSIRDDRLASAEPALLKRLDTETDPSLVELLGAALMRTRDLRGLPGLQARADREPDPALKARLIWAASRLADHDYRMLDWLTSYAHSPEPWARAAGCVGLLQLGRLEGGDLLLRIHDSLPEGPRDFALQEFQRIMDPMGQTVGSILNWPDDAEPRRAELAWARAGELWRRFATRELLSDVLMRVDRSDPDWRAVERILHGRWYASKWIH